MEQHLKTIRDHLKTNPVLPPYEAYVNDDQIHLRCSWGDLARLRPESHPDRWKMEFYLNRDRWRCFDFTGTLDECLELLYEAPHYLFWEG